jgi:hypothetical protein
VATCLTLEFQRWPTVSRRARPAPSWNNATQVEEDSTQPRSAGFYFLGKRAGSGRRPPFFVRLKVEYLKFSDLARMLACLLLKNKTVHGCIAFCWNFDQLNPFDAVGFRWEVTPVRRQPDADTPPRRGHERLARVRV